MSYLFGLMTSLCVMIHTAIKASIFMILMSFSLEIDNEMQE